MLETSRITLEEAARRLSVSPDEVRRYVRVGKLQAIGDGESYRILWPESDPSREIYPRARPAVEEVKAANGHASKTGEFPESEIQPETNNARDPKWLVPMIMFLWISLFLVGGVWLVYIVLYASPSRVGR